MRYEDGHKDETHRRILDVASRLFCKNGIGNVGIALIMKEAGLTNGAFYAHFKSKEALVAEMLGDLLDQREFKYTERNSTIAEFLKEYLSPLHRDNPECGCPMAALLSELVFHSKLTRKIFTEKAESLLTRLASQIQGAATKRNRNAIAIVSMLIGALQLSRAVTDKKLSDEILSSVYTTATTLIAV